MTDTNINNTQHEIQKKGVETTTDVIGIGGQDGLVYDVNKLKRNRVQEAIQNYKEDLLVLLWTLGIDNKVAAAHTSPITTTTTTTTTTTATTKATTTTTNTFDDIHDLSSMEKYQFMDEKILGLVQMNPVSTTTDSNLLEGKWTFAYASQNAAKKIDADAPPPPPKQSNTTNKKKLPRLTTHVSRHTSSNTVIIKGGTTTTTHVVGEPWKMTQNTEGFFRTSTRTVILENLNDSEDPYIIDQTRLLGGLWTLETYYHVKHLTRKTLHISPLHYNIHIFNKYKWKKSPKTGDGQIEVLYLDSDLCICRPLAMEQEHSETNAGPLLLYTKSEVWTNSKERVRRKV